MSDWVLICWLTDVSYAILKFMTRSINGCSTVLEADSSAGVCKSRLAHESHCVPVLLIRNPINNRANSDEYQDNDTYGIDHAISITFAGIFIFSH